MVILGIDPGLAIVGWGVIDYGKNRFRTIDYGSLQTPAGEATETRLVNIYSGMQELIKRYKPSCMAVEELFFNTNITTGIRVSQARGVILLAAAQAGIEIAEYTPLQVKQAITGYGRAEKRQVMEMVKNFLNLERVPKPDDTADALAPAVCHAHYSGTAYSRLWSENK